MAGLALGADRPESNPRRVTVFTGDEILPQVVGGGAWQTTIQLMNMGTVPAHVFVDFYGNDGNPLAFQIVGESSAVSTIERDIPVGGSLRIETATGSEIPLNVGYAWITTETDMERVGGMAILCQRIPGREDYEAVVPVNSIFDPRIIFPFDNVRPYTTTFAMVNPFDVEASVSVVVRNEAGEQIDTEAITLAPYEHRNFIMRDTWEAAVDNERGAVEFQTKNTGGLSVMGLRFNDTGAFTSFHGLTMWDWAPQEAAPISGAIAARPTRSAVR